MQQYTTCPVCLSTQAELVPADDADSSPTISCLRSKCASNGGSIYLGLIQRVLSTLSDGNDPWWVSNVNLSLIARFMFDRGNSSADIFYMLEKPWEFQHEFQAAQRARLAVPE
jgi:hypothetical protein